MSRLANEDSLARPEGFEPPTPRSVVSFDAQSQETKWKTSRDERWLFPAIPSDMGAIVGTGDGHKLRSLRRPRGRGEDRGFAQVRTREEVKRFALGVYAKWVTICHKVKP
jgi:hypothetical protein